MTDVRVVRYPIVIRRYSGDEQEHVYPADGITADCAFAVSMCRRSHPRGMVSRVDLPAFSGMVDRCPSCAAWARHNQHAIVVRSEVATS